MPSRVAAQRKFAREKQQMRQLSEGGEPPEPADVAAPAPAASHGPSDAAPAAARASSGREQSRGGSSTWREEDFVQATFSLAKEASSPRGSKGASVEAPAAAVQVVAAPAAEAASADGTPRAHGGIKSVAFGQASESAAEFSPDARQLHHRIKALQQRLINSMATHRLAADAANGGLDDVAMRL